MISKYSILSVAVSVCLIGYTMGMFIDAGLLDIRGKGLQINTLLDFHKREVHDNPQNVKSDEQLEEESEIVHKREANDNEESEEADVIKRDAGDKENDEESDESAIIKREANDNENSGESDESDIIKREAEDGNNDENDDGASPKSNENGDSEGNIDDNDN